MGLFDIWGGNPSDQAEMAMIAGLLGGRGNLGGIIGRGIQSGMGTYGQAAAFEQQKKTQDAATQYHQDQLGLERQKLDLMRQPKPGESPFAKIDPTKYTPESVRAFMSTGNYGDLVPGPDADKVSPIGQLMMERDKLPPGHPMRSVYDEAIKKASTHQPPTTSISFGSPMPAVNPKTGEVELMRPDNKGGMSFTGIKPAPQQRDNKIPAEIQRMNIAATSMEKLLDEYEAMIKQNNPRDPSVQMNPALRAKMQSKTKNIQLQFKELQALGALTGPDVAMMEAALTDPFTFQGAYYGKGGLLNQIGEARNLIKIRREAMQQETGRAATPQGVPPTPSQPSNVIDWNSLK